MNSKRIMLLLSLLLTAFFLSGCGNSDSGDPEKTVEFLYTSVASTALAQISTTPEVTATAMPSSTPEPSQTPLTTPTASPTTSAASGYVYVATSTLCDNAAYVSDVTYADNTVLAPETDFTKTWKLMNTGTCTWDEDYRLVFISGDDMDGDTTYLDDSVSSGESVSISVDMTSPEDSGTYTGYWQMENADGETFGGKIYVQIKVSSSVTSTPTRTLTPTRTSTGSTSTPTTAKTATATAIPATSTPKTVPPTSTPLPPTSTPVPTSTEVVVVAPTETSAVSP